MLFNSNKINQSVTKTGGFFGEQDTSENILNKARGELFGKQYTITTKRLFGKNEHRTNDVCKKCLFYLLCNKLNIFEQFPHIDDVPRFNQDMFDKNDCNLFNNDYNELRQVQEYLHNISNKIQTTNAARENIKRIFLKWIDRLPLDDKIWFNVNMIVFS